MRSPFLLRNSPVGRSGSLPGDGRPHSSLMSAPCDRLFAMVLNRNPAPPAKPTNLYSESCGFVTLYTDDIDAIKRYLETRCETVTLAAGRATADEGIDLLGATEAEWSDVRLETKNPSIQVSLLPQAARVLTYEDREEARELVRATASIVREHRSSLLATTSTIEALYLAFAIVVLGATTRHYFLHERPGALEHRPHRRCSGDLCSLRYMGGCSAGTSSLGARWVVAAVRQNARICTSWSKRGTSRPAGVSCGGGCRRRNHVRPHDAEPMTNSKTRSHDHAGLPCCVGE